MTEYGGGTNSQLTFLDTDDLILGADTQATDFDFRDFTCPSDFPSQTQTQASQSDHLAGSSQVCIRFSFVNDYSCLCINHDDHVIFIVFRNGKDKKRKKKLIR